MGTLYESFEKELAACELRYNESAADELVAFVPLALEREELVAVGYRENVLHPAWHRSEFPMMFGTSSITPSSGRGKTRKCMPSTSAAHCSNLQNGRCGFRHSAVNSPAPLVAGQHLFASTSSGPLLRSRGRQQQSYPVSAHWPAKFRTTRTPAPDLWAVSQLLSL